LLSAIRASGPGAGSPSPIETFLGAHPKALGYVQAPKPVPASFLKESFYSVNAHRFVNAAGRQQYGRYRIRPDGSNEYLEPAAAAMRSNDFLFDSPRAVDVWFGSDQMPEFQNGEQTRTQWNQAMREQVIGQWKGQDHSWDLPQFWCNPA
jgi:hypothetical protein